MLIQYNHIHVLILMACDAVLRCCRYQRVQCGSTVPDRRSNGIHDQRTDRRQLYSHVTLHVLRHYSDYLPCLHTEGTRYIDLELVSSFY